MVKCCGEETEKVVYTFDQVAVYVEDEFILSFEVTTTWICHVCNYAGFT